MNLEELICRQVCIELQPKLFQACPVEVEI